MQPTVLKNGELGGKYNVQGEAELDNLEVAQFVAKELGKPLHYVMHDEPDTRPGHDLRYLLDGSKLREMGWNLPLTFEDSLRKFIQWTVANPQWMELEGFMGTPASEKVATSGAMKPGSNVTSAIREGEAAIKVGNQAAMVAASKL
tara:strand:+ start:1616 stop:2053 length:438 start_codon:yes stop_codon:yes gene_type:complete